MSYRVRVGPALVLAFMLGAGCGGNDDPALAITSPRDGVYVAGIVDIEIEGTAASELDQVVLRAGTVEVARFTQPPFIAQLDTTVIPDGPITLTAEATLTGEGTLDPVSISVHVDNDPPSIEILPPHAAYREDGETFTVRLLVSDGNGITKVAGRVVGDGTDTRHTEYDPSGLVVMAFDWNDVVVGPVTEWSEVQVTARVVDGFGRESEVVRTFDLGTRLLWSHNVAGLMVRPPVVADDGTVWVGATKVAPDEGRIVRMDPISGVELCDNVLGIETLYSGAQAGGLIVFGTSRAVRAYRRDDCGLAWTFGDPVNDPRSYWGTPAHDAAAGVVYAADATGRIVAIDAATGAGSVLADVAEQIQSSPIVTATGDVLVGAESGRLYAFDSAGAALSWSPYSAAGSIFGDPVLASNTVYVGSMDTFLYAIDSATGMLRPGFGVAPDGFAIRSTPGIAPDGTALVATIAGTLFSIAPDGTPGWSYDIGPISRGGVRIHEAQGGGWSAYIGSTDGRVYAFNDAGVVLWRAQTGADIQTYGALDATTYYTPSDDFRLYAYDIRSLAP